MKSKFQLTAAMAATCAIAFTGCGGDQSAGAKSGGQAATVTIRLGAVEGKDAPYADEVEHFANSVETMTDGSLHVDVVWEATGPHTAQSEKDLADMVSKGDIDLAIVPTRVWDQLDVSTLQALQTPFLVDSLGLVNKIVSSDLAGEMMAGLDKAGVDGLALWPDSMRHPISFGAPLLTAGDFRGTKLLMALSDMSSRLAAAIGVEPVNPPDWGAAVAAGEMQGAESAYVWSSALPAFGTFTANITFFPKVNTVAANKLAFEKLTPERQDVLRRAATETLGYVESTNKSDHDLAADYCAANGGVALADDSTLSDLTTLAQPLVAELEHDAFTKRLISEIRTMKAQTTTPDPLPVACARKTHEAPVTTDTGVGTATFPEGVYRTNSPVDGVVTMSYIDGVWKRIKENGDLDCEATFVVHSGRIWLSMSTDSALSCGDVPGHPFLDAAWTLNGDQLRFVDINSDPPAVQEFSLPWTRIDGS
jgi:TRAP-type C4-dicarboxylate transport system substrate-binding protein